MENFLSYRKARFGWMIKMKFEPLRGTLKDHLGLTSIVLAVVVLLVLSVTTPSFTALADEEEEVPEWEKGYRWRYRESIPMPDMPDDIETEFEMEVVGDGRVNIPVEGGDDISDDTYEVKETVDLDEDNQTEIEFHYRKDDLAQLYNNPEYDIDSGYAPAIVRLDFPLWVGKEWNGDARRFLNPVEDPELDKNFGFWGNVENRTSVDTGAGEFEDTYMVNLTVLQYVEEGGEDVIEEVRRFEIYYSPEVKNIVHQDNYATREVPDDYEGPGEGEDFKEDWVGNETLIDYSLEADEEEEEEEASFVGVGIFLVIIGAGTASFYVYKKVKKSL